YANSAGEMVRRLAEFLKVRLAVADPQFSAEMLLSMLAGLDRMKRLFAVPPGPESETARAARIVDLFLKAHQR
ncbi:MAG TPA: TetR/AcrR family transcriptional regulator C-terminal domain-containing protein, partial [Burkholderiales bacterium]|nr:TetR/AcrR family transcriptional regulator C-terminal domain-containing protein [Burkholderiales bacterium]